MKTTKLVGVACLLILWGCTPKPPPQPPQPPISCPPGQHLEGGKCVPDPVIPPPTDTTTVPPVAPIGLDLLLRNDGTGKFLRGGAPHSIKMAIPCWSDIENKLFIEGPTPDSPPVEIPYLWPLVSPEWMRYTKGKGWNAGEIRPFFRDTCCGLEKIGGPYLQDGSWNPEFWKVYHSTLWTATALKWNLLVDVADGWIAKHCIWGDKGGQLCPFVSQKDSEQFFAVPLNPSLKKWVAKLVSETDNYAGVIFQISNESEQARFPDPNIPSWSPEWERAMHAEIRAAEKNVVHMIASNTRDYSGPYDIFTVHDPIKITGPEGNRPVIVNEYNPHLDPARFKSLHCAAAQLGQTFAYWRSDGSLSDQTGSINVDCDAPSTCPPPIPDRSKLTFSITCTHNGVCDATPIVKGDCEYCASIGMGSIGGVPRCSCPARNECPGTPGYTHLCGDRVACEQYLISVPGKSILSPIWVVDSGEVVLVDEYGFRARCNGCSSLRACNADLSVCSEAPLQ